ncbi:winged helix-turn-helix transcriptional regulator [Amycolatopsis sp. NPDC026612]|uniref:winged helix-turn-helix transcriptional regulator n=1 Tax=Amycolatopsis sp. NPDC026612 TaxID=3155466 RepID=UPI0033FBD907
MSEVQSGVAVDRREGAVAAVAASAQREAIIGELGSPIGRTYGQYCGVARAMEVLGERWALLVVRDLLVSAKTYAELLRGLPRVPADILSSRLRELTRTGVVRERLTPAGPTVYELTEAGLGLEDVLLTIGRWGAGLLDVPRSDEIVTVDSLVMALRTTFVPSAAGDTRVTYEVHFGDIVLNASVADGAVRVAAGPLPGADLVLEAGTSLKDLLTGDLTPAGALATDLVRISGDPALLDRFAEMFRIFPHGGS